MFHVRFIREKKEIEVPEGTTILDAEIRAGLIPDAPCGGQGKCGKCLVRAEGTVTKACQTAITKDLEVDTLLEHKENRILTEGLSRPVAFMPDLHQQKVILKRAKAGENISDWEMLTTQLTSGEEIVPDLELAGSIYQRRKESDEWYAVHTGRKIMELRKEAGKVCFAAFDIGTTTVVGYLLDACDGRVLAVRSRMNPQSQYGADVIMRANYALEHSVEALSSCIQKAVDEMLGELAEAAEIQKEDIFQVCVVGNTCMHHLFLGISPASLVHAPYNPALSQGMILRAAEAGLHVHPKAELIMLPDIAGYVGADTCGCILTLRQDKKEKISLMIDIGTNGEMVLGNKDRLVCCSTAAGPAFEGAKIECGMRGARGAVDHVHYENGAWSYTTVGQVPAAGLCGSGLIDLVAQLLKAGLIDETGRLQSGQAQENIFVLVPPKDAGNDRGVYLTQKDIREVQLAKAAIAAGIGLLMKELKITEKEIDQVYLAGAFGNYMDPESAAAIGMIPWNLLSRIVPVGNAAGEGAKIALLNSQERGEMNTLMRKIEFVELATSPEFQDCFVDELNFPEEEEV